jgi:pimeloyl-ACP methyl ester carboxylesterase
MEATAATPTTVQVATGVELAYRREGAGEPLLLKAVADRIPGARFELLEGPGSSHALHFEHTDEFVALVRDFLSEHPL